MLFFVSVGMVIDPKFLVEEPVRVLIVVAIVVVGKAAAAMAIVLALGRPLWTGLTVAAGLSQIGEFSFILAEMGGSLGLLPPDGRSLILVAALISILLNPVLFALVDPIEARFGLARAARTATSGRDTPGGA